MPYKCEKMKTPAQYDRRNKVTPEMAETMRQMFADGIPLRAIAREFKVHHRTVKLHINHEYAAAETQRRKIEKPWLRYYDTDQRRIVMRKYRQHKRDLELAGKLS